MDCPLDLGKLDGPEAVRCSMHPRQTGASSLSAVLSTAPARPPAASQAGSLRCFPTPGTGAMRVIAPFHVLFLQRGARFSFCASAWRFFSASSAFLFSSLASLYRHLGICR